MELAHLKDDERVSQRSFGNGALSPRDDPRAGSRGAGQFGLRETFTCTVSAESEEFVTHANHVRFEFGNREQAVFDFVDARGRPETFQDLDNGRLMRFSVFIEWLDGFCLKGRGRRMDARFDILIKYFPSISAFYGS